MRPKLKIQPKQKPKKISKKARKTQGTQKKQKIQKKKKVDRGIDSLVYDLFIYSSGLSTDTRTIQRGNFFIALSGERFDGNAYAHEAWDRDAICIVVSSISSELKRRISLNPGVKVHKVPDTHAFLCSLAAYHRQQFNIPVIAIAGSNGKTTTKELVMSVLRTKHKVLATAENENNSIGVSKTILRLNKKHELAVIELGTNRKGELKALCEIAKPNHGYITSIGKEHLEGFMDIRGVTEEETALYRYILKNNPDPMLFIPENVAELAPYAKIREIKSLSRHRQRAARGQP